MPLSYRYAPLLGLFLLLNSCQSTRPAFDFGARPVSVQARQDSADVSTAPAAPTVAAAAATAPRPPLIPQTSRRLSGPRLRPAAARPIAVRLPRRAAHWAAARPLRQAAALRRPKVPTRDADTLTLFMLLGLGVVMVLLGVLMLFTFTPTTILIGLLMLAGSIPALLISVAGLRYNLRKR